ncbi:hypothetical protein JZ751_017702 [Albula glossodonta]|uniref:Uncharacterized protein n=1 Tax=Albula glossodonta TaxID=121402 RepID=A0A8T2PP55_9TELE|nr:hypothetical protein JZ751_017702 [Albula glossodonta]
MQTQLSEMEQSHSISEGSARLRDEAQREAERLRIAQREAERTLAARERAHRHRVKGLEEQVSTLKEQLQQEMRRRQPQLPPSLMSSGLAEYVFTSSFRLQHVTITDRSTQPGVEKRKSKPRTVDEVQAENEEASLLDLGERQHSVRVMSCSSGCWQCSEKSMRLQRGKRLQTGQA